MTHLKFVLVMLTGIALVAVAPVGATPRGEPEPAAWNLEQLNEHFRVAEGTRIEIDNPHGNVRIRALPLGSDIQVTVNVQSVGEWARTPVVTRDRSDDGVLRLGLGTREGDLDRQETDDGAGLVRADFTVGIPDAMPLAVELADGSFTMHEASYPVTLRARHGDINLRTSGTLDVRIDGGSVRYLPPTDSRPAGGRIQTSSAEVNVLLAAPDLLNFQTISGAAVTSDSVQVLQSRSREGRATRFHLDDGAETLEIQTDTGPIRLIVEGFR